MSRTLNPHLFGTVDAPVNTVGPQSAPSSKKIRELEAQIDTVHQKLEKWVKMLDSKMQQLHQAQKNINENIKQMSANYMEQQAAILSRFNERRGIESKTHEMIDRHNQVINSFDQKIQQIQKVATEQELKLIAYKSTYDEILREIRNLK